MEYNNLREGTDWIPKCHDPIWRLQLPSNKNISKNAVVISIYSLVIHLDEKGVEMFFFSDQGRRRFGLH